MSGYNLIIDKNEVSLQYCNIAAHFSSLLKYLHFCCKRYCTIYFAFTKVIDIQPCDTKKPEYQNVYHGRNEINKKS